MDGQFSVPLPFETGSRLRGNILKGNVETRCLSKGRLGGRTKTLSIYSNA